MTQRHLFYDVSPSFVKTNQNKRRPNIYLSFSCKSPLKPFESASSLSIIVFQSFMSLSIFCRHNSSSIQCKSAGRGEDKEMQPGEREIEQSSVQNKAVQSAQPAQHNDRRLCLQIIRASMFLYSQALSPRQ